jgi:hypothetical protein
MTDILQNYYETDKITIQFSFSYSKFAILVWSVRYLSKSKRSPFYPNNELASFHEEKFDANKLGFYLGMGWMITTNFGQQIVLYSGSSTHRYNALLSFKPPKWLGYKLPGK